MDNSGEVADLMVKESIQLTEAAVKMLAAGSKNLAAFLMALSQNNKKLYGKANMARLLQTGRELKTFHIKESDLEDFRAYAKKNVLFSGTIASNLRFGNPDASDAEIEQAAEIAQAMEFIREKPDRFDSDISQGGTNVSGGQKQRLTIARAIAKHPKVFVFDDSFSALDLKTDAALRKALGEQVQDSTMIIVAQRISTILHADQILVLEEGKIVGKGTHEELLRSCEVYQQIAKSQLSAAELGLEEDTEKGAVTDGE